MKHIKTPVVYEKEDMTIWGRDGQWIATLALGWLAPELVTSINEHDKLVAERDALVKACEAFISKIDERQGDMFQEDGDRLDWLNDIFYYEIYDFRAAIKGEGSGNDEHAKRDVLIGVLESIDLVTEQLGETVAGGVFKGGFLGVRAQVVAALALVRGETE